MIIAVYLSFWLSREHADAGGRGRPTQGFVVAMLMNAGRSRHWILLNSVSLFAGREIELELSSTWGSCAASSFEKQKHQR